MSCERDISIDESLLHLKILWQSTKAINIKTLTVDKGYKQMKKFEVLADCKDTMYGVNRID